MSRRSPDAPAPYLRRRVAARAVARGRVGPRRRAGPAARRRAVAGAERHDLREATRTSMTSVQHPCRQQHETHAQHVHHGQQLSRIHAGVEVGITCHAWNGQFDRSRSSIWSTDQRRRSRLLALHADQPGNDQRRCGQYVHGFERARRSMPRRPTRVVMEVTHGRRVASLHDDSDDEDGTPASGWSIADDGLGNATARGGQRSSNARRSRSRARSARRRAPAPPSPSPPARRR